MCDTMAAVGAGMQAERTRLSWNRTGLAIAMNAAFLVRVDVGTIWTHLPAIGMLFVAIACFFYGRIRYRAIGRAIRHGVTPTSVIQNRVLVIVAVAPAVIALIGVVVW